MIKRFFQKNKKITGQGQMCKTQGRVANRTFFYVATQPWQNTNISPLIYKECKILKLTQRKY